MLGIRIGTQKIFSNDLAPITGIMENFYWISLCECRGPHYYNQLNSYTRQSGKFLGIRLVILEHKEGKEESNKVLKIK